MAARGEKGGGWRLGFYSAGARASGWKRSSSASMSRTGHAARIAGWARTSGRWGRAARSPGDGGGALGSQGARLGQGRGAARLGRDGQLGLGTRVGRREGEGAGWAKERSGPQQGDEVVAGWAKGRCCAAGPRRGGRDRLGQQEKEGELGCSEWGETSGPRREKEKEGDSAQEDRKEFSIFGLNTKE